MGAYKCKYGSGLCGGIFDLCDECQLDARAARNNPPQQLNVNSMSSEQLMELRRSIDRELESRKSKGVHIRVQF